MKVLHICNDYCGSKVHQNLYSELDKQGVEQMVYTYFRESSLTGKNKFEGEHTRFVYRPILKLRHRLLYHQKVNIVSQDLLTQIEHGDFDLAHATTLFSDGAVAYRLWKLQGIPYVVTVRNTDINEFLGYAPHTWLMGMRILKNARRIVFISKAPMEKFCRHIAVRPLLKQIRHKFVLQPNGIDHFWLENVVKEQPVRNFNIIYVGKFDRNKNVMKLIEAILKLKPTIPELKLHLVGGDGSKWGGVISECKKYPETIVYHGKIYDKAQLRDLYRQCSIFAMPSHHETFGLVYVEALSQHLAVVYTKGQGIDGLLDERVGERVNSRSCESIKAAIVQILAHRDSYRANEVVDFEMFDWQRIASKYKTLYEETIMTYT